MLSGCLANDYTTLSMEESIKRPATLNERRIQGEKLYKFFYNHYKTHFPGDWSEPDWGGDYMLSFPPYSYRFDEFFGYILTLGIGITNALNIFFPNPDKIDLDYLEDILFALDQMVDADTGYICTKGIGVHIGPSSPFFKARYQASLSEARLWLATSKEELNNKASFQSESGTEQSILVQDGSAPTSALASKLFLNGFNADKFTQMLIALGILTESRKHTADSKPRNWRAVIESLRENKRLVYNANTTLFDFITSEFSYPYKIRAIQGPFNSKNSDTEDIYKKANRWCAANR